MIKKYLKSICFGYIIYIKLLMRPSTCIDPSQTSIKICLWFREWNKADILDSFWIPGI